MPAVHSVGLHSSPIDLTASEGQSTFNPLHSSIRSHSPAAARHVVLSGLSVPMQSTQPPSSSEHLSFSVQRCWSLHPASTVGLLYSQPLAGLQLIVAWHWETHC